jgi:hypothetical protein
VKNGLEDPRSKIQDLGFGISLLVCLFASAATADETHWSLKPVARPTVPALANPKWKPRNPIDNFVFAKLAEAKLSPSPEAPRHTLIRRLYFDLIGLPPTPAEVSAFERDRSPNAYEKVVEHLLASPRYGERWARHWLDVVRFAETHGFEMNNPRPNAWQYRDYVIRAFNEDKPYDRFMIEQFAGDALGEDAATGFLVGGAWDQVKSPDPVLTAAQRADELHDMVSTTGSAFLGLTVGCARCHNHKFDPIPQTEYYAIKACLSGVQHGERKVRTPDQVVREEEAEQLRKKLATVEFDLERFEPTASTGRILLLDSEPAFGSRLTQQLKRATRVAYPAGTSRGERDDPGDLTRLANFTASYLAWSNAANTDVFAYEPRVDGRFHVWLSWGCGWGAYAKEAAYLIDRDGDLTTTNDQVEIARVNQQQFADGTGDTPNKSLWSGFYDAGVRDLSSSNRILLRGGATNVQVTAAVVAIVEESSAAVSATDPKPISTDSPASGEGDSLSLRERAGVRGNGSAVPPASEPHAAVHFLRAPVNGRKNVERFAPIKAKFLRFTILRTSDAEPCIDELEVFTEGPKPRNIALASVGTKASASSVFPNSDIHRLEHIIDGKFGNSRSWISNERSKGWIMLEFPEEVSLNRIVWGRDREQKLSDRLPLDYRIEVGASTNDWRLIASSQDRVPYMAGRPAETGLTVGGLSEASVRELKELLAERPKLETRINELTTGPMIYAGTFAAKPEPTHRLQRGDAMQEREVIEPSGLSAIPVSFHPEQSIEPPVSGNSLPAVTEEQKRRLALAKWLADPANPLPARVMVNRLWQHHFGEGIVSTPSDFGKNGARPSHPELLDWLAAEFIKPTIHGEIRTPKSERSPKSESTIGKAETLDFGLWTLDSGQPWSLKHIHRLIVTSATYRQASASRPEGIAADAASRLLWRFPPQRLEAEPLRDTILAVSGKLNLRTGGPGFSVFETNDNYVRVYNPKKQFGPDEWRRMIYMTKVRMQQDATFGAFDCPDGGQIAPKRMRSTTPLQALNLLNSEFMFEQTGFFAARLEREAGKNVKAQVSLAFALAYNRSPDAGESRASQALIARHGLPIFCRALFNSNEFLFVE